jgi:hypothetical protein
MLRSLVSKWGFGRFALLYVANCSNRYLRAALAATDGPDFYKRRLWSRYLTPDPRFKPIPLSPEFEVYLETLRRDGIVMIEGAFDGTAAAMRALVEALELTNHRRLDDVIDYEIDLGFAHPEVLRMLAHADLCGMLCNYFSRQARYREHPRLVAMSAGAAGVDRSSSRVHCDGYRQITLHLLVNDVTPSDTHLVFYKRTHRQPKLNYTRVPENSKLVDVRDAMFATARAGTLVVFDSGSGYHQGAYTPGQRILLGLVVTTGWLPFQDPSRVDADVFRAIGERQPPHVRAMFARD